MKNKRKIVGVIIAIVVMIAICIVPLVMIPDSEFGGADGIADELVTQIEAGHEPWFSPIWEPPGGETESLLFALQAALGSGVFCFFLGYFVASRKNKANSQTNENFGK